MSTFESPLRIRNREGFRRIRFGAVELSAELIDLRRQLHNVLTSTAAQLPSLPREEIKSTIHGYAGGENFFSLFYVPVWSFLHWLPPIAPSEITAAALDHAKTAQALSLFLHLWDDHLSDGQLSPDVDRLHFRTLAWQDFISAAYRFCELSSLPKSIVDEHVAKYLTAQHSTSVATNTDEYCSQFSDEFAICTLIPRLLGHGAFAATNVNELYRAIDLFSVSWRLLDDVQDIDADVMKSKPTAVWLELDDTGRARWQRCQHASLHQHRLDTSTWTELCAAISDSGCVTRLLTRIERTMNEAIEIGTANRWPELVRELEQMRRGITFAQATYSISTTSE